jgi:hypothetical protein
MGMERVVPVAGEISWPAIRDRLLAAGVVAQMRMVDNMPAFPDEEPPADWRELRVSLGHGMITLRREAQAIRIIVWGNADEATQRDQEMLGSAIG